MKLVAKAMALILATSVAQGAVVFTEDFQSGWYNNKQVQWDANWIGVNNNNGFQTIDTGGGDFQAARPVGWRGATYVGSSITGWDVNETVTIKMNYTAGLTVNGNNYKTMFGLTDTSTNLLGNAYMADTDGNTLGFAMESNWWPGDGSGQSTTNGSVKMLAYKGAPNADSVGKVAEDWGLAMATGDTLGDEMSLLWSATKTATAGEFLIDISVSNTVSGASWSNTGISHTDTARYNASELWFTTDSYADNGNVSADEMRWDDLSVEVIPEPATLGLITAFGGAVLFIRRRFLI